eukprot:13894976-Alexandrium_andersonii.AAC.1
MSKPAGSQISQGPAEGRGPPGPCATVGAGERDEVLSGLRVQCPKLCLPLTGLPVLGIERRRSRS